MGRWSIERNEADHAPIDVRIEPAYLKKRQRRSHRSPIGADPYHSGRGQPTIAARQLQ
jgi:hypothetical protein